LSVQGSIQIYCVYLLAQQGVYQPLESSKSRHYVLKTLFLEYFIPTKSH